ncbi:MAG TPA: Flp pilus assembly protein CpaB, partial [Actinomycetota bacterium]|nr:Flp pilus assembly protein CpaB [Actinomycetota bacterium]
RDGPGRPVVVATTDLDRGTALEPSMLETRKIPARFLPPGRLVSAEEAIGRTLAASVLAGEPVTSARLAPSGGPVAALIPAALRAVPVPSVLPPSAVRPGDRVDVHATFGTGQPYTETVVTGAEVLTVASTGSVGTEPSPGGTLLILVGPESAERLAFARAFADLSVALVSAADVPTLGDDDQGEA